MNVSMTCHLRKFYRPTLMMRRLLEVFEVERYNTGFGGFSWGVMAAIVERFQFGGSTKVPRNRFMT